MGVTKKKRITVSCVSLCCYSVLACVWVHVKGCPLEVIQTREDLCSWNSTLFLGSIRVQIKIKIRQGSNHPRALTSLHSVQRRIEFNLSNSNRFPHYPITVQTDIICISFNYFIGLLRRHIISGKYFTAAWFSAPNGRIFFLPNVSTHECTEPC